MIGYPNYLKKCNRCFYLHQNTYLQRSNILLHIKIGDLFTIVQFAVVENLAVHALPSKAFIDEHNLAILPDGQKVTARRSTPLAIVKPLDVSGNAAFTEKHAKCKEKESFRGNKRSTIDEETLEHSSSRQGKVLELLSITLIMTETKTNVLLNFDPDPDLVFQGR